MKLFINVKQLGKRRDVIGTKEIYLDPVPTTTAGLITAIVALQVKEYNDRPDQNELLTYLTDPEIQRKATVGKIDFGVNYNDNSADPEKAIRNALLSFEDGIFRVFLNDNALDTLQEEIHPREGDRLTFVRLTMLAGRIW